MTDVTIFAPSPTLTVTVEDHPHGSEVHVHAGGQGVWQGRMLLRLGASVTMCSVLTGEIGQVVRDLLEDQGITVSAVAREGRGAAYIHDRRGGERVPIAEEEGDPIGRHELDELYGMVLKEGMASRAVILSGPSGDLALPADTYRRLAADLRAADVAVVVDLAGERMAAALEGGVDLLKVSHEELLDDGLIADDSPGEILRAMRSLRERGADVVVVSRSSQPLLLLDETGLLEVRTPQLEVADTRGAGDSLTAGLAAGIARGDSVRDAVTLGAAAGAMNVTRHGLGSGDVEVITQLRQKVQVREIADDLSADVEQPTMESVSPDGLAALVETEEEA